MSRQCAHTPNQHNSEEQQQREAQRRRVVMVVMVEVFEESSASSHRLAAKESKGGGCKEGWGWGGVKEAGMSSGMDRVLHTGPPAGPILTLFFASITAPLSTSGSTRSRSPL